MLLGWLADNLKPPTGLRILTATLVTSFAAIALRTAIDPLLPPGVPFLSMWLAVDIATLWASWPAGVATALIGAAWGWYAWLPPKMSASAVAGSLWIIVFYLILSLGQVALLQIARSALLQMKANEDARQYLVGELSHRLRNQFALMSSIVQHTLRASPDPTEAAAILQGRMKALAAALEFATRDSAPVQLLNLVEQVVRPVAPSPEVLRLAGPRYAIPANLVSAFALVLHELATNAVKHGAWRAASGRVDVNWHCDPSGLLLVWTETGGTSPATCNRAGFGSQLIERGIPGATVTKDWSGDRLTVTFTIPLDVLAMQRSERG